MNNYVSCIKIRGQPILPPLMTDDVRSEMTYYKQLAVAVEEKISRLRLSSLDSSSESSSDDNSTSSVTKKTQTEVVSQKEYFSDDDTFTRSTDINKYFLNKSELFKTKQEISTTTITIIDAVKPQIPTSLDIVPITVDKPRKRRHKSFSDIDDCDTEPSTLVRQGSYTLDTPSPMLLAHMENSKDNSRDFYDDLHSYTPTTSTDRPKRKEWNINQAINNWTNKNKENIIYREIKSENDAVPKKKITLDNPNLIVIGKSVDFIQHILPIKSTVNEEEKSKDEISTDGIKDNINSKQNLVNKFSGSLGTLSKVDNLPDKNQQIETDRMTKSLDVSSFDNDNLQKNVKRSLTSERLLQVFKEIQKTHEKQMAELVERQKNEQFMMQKTFEKQQLLLLDQIDKTFPGVSVANIVQEISSTNGEIYDKLSNRNKNNSNLLRKNSDNQGSDFACRSDNESTSFNGSFDSEGKLSMSLHLSGDKVNFDCKNSEEKRRSSVSRQLFPLESQSTRIPVPNDVIYDEKQIQAATKINAYVKGYLVRRLMQTERVIALKNTYREALHCMLKLHVDAPLELPELEFHQRLQLQCDAASINIVELFSQSPGERMKVISNDRQIQRARMERSTSARSSISFATQRTLARKKLKEMGISQLPNTARSSTTRSRCQTWASNSRDKRSPCVISTGIKRSTSAGAVRRPWR